MRRYGHATGASITAARRNAAAILTRSRARKAPAAIATARARAVMAPRYTDDRPCRPSRTPTRSARFHVRFSWKRSSASSARGRNIVTCACRCARRIQRWAPTAKNTPPTNAAQRSPLARRTRSCAPRPESTRLASSTRLYPSTGPPSRMAGAPRTAGSSRFSEKARASGSGWKIGAWNSRAGSWSSACTSQARIQALSRPSGRSITPLPARSVDERPAHDRDRDRVSGERPADLAAGAPDRRRAADGADPRAAPTRGRRRSPPAAAPARR